MTETLAQAVRVDGSQKRAIIILAVVVVLLLLLWKRVKPATNISNVTQQVLPGLSVDPSYATYDVPSIGIPNLGGRSGAWDWMQTSDCACDCSCEDFKPSTPASIAQTSYVFVGATSLSAAPSFDFPTYQAPPLPTWWLDQVKGFNRYTDRQNNWFGPIPLTVIRTSDGHYCQYDYTYRYAMAGVVGQGGFTQSGEYLYLNGQRYAHNARRDNSADPNGDYGHYGYQGNGDGYFHEGG